MSAGSKPRVIIADDHLLFVEGLLRVVESECEIVATCSNGRELVESTARLLPDIVLLDISMPSLNGLESARQIRAQADSIKIVFLTMLVDREYVREAFAIGARGYLSKKIAANELKEAIRQVLNGRYAFSPALSRSILGYEAADHESPAGLFADLTPRQREVLQLVGEGRSAKQIAGELSISVKTVEFHKKQLMMELRLQSSAELIRYAVRKGWDGSAENLPTTIDQ